MIGWEGFTWTLFPLGRDDNRLFEHELRKNFHSFSNLVKINDKTANLNSIFKYLDVT